MQRNSTCRGRLQSITISQFRDCSVTTDLGWRKAGLPDGLVQRIHPRRRTTGFENRLQFVLLSKKGGQPPCLSGRRSDHQGQIHFLRIKRVGVLPRRREGELDQPILFGLGREDLQPQRWFNGFALRPHVANANEEAQREDHSIDHV